MSAPAAAAKAPKKVASHPTYGEMIKKAVTELKERGGSSRAAILKYISAHFKVGDNATQVNAHLRMALKRGVASGALKQAKGTGATGSFKIGEKAVVKKAAAPKKAATSKKPATPKKAATSTSKKAATSKKSATSTSKTAAPKKSATPKKATNAKKAATPKKTAKTQKKTDTKKKAATPKKATGKKWAMREELW